MYSSKKTGGNPLKKITEKIGELNAKRRELADVEEQIRFRNEDAKVAGEKLVKIQQEIDIRNVELELINADERKVGEREADIRHLDGCLVLLKESINVQIEQNKLELEEALQDIRTQIREAHQVHQDDIALADAEIKSKKNHIQILTNEIQELQKNKEEETKLLESVRAQFRAEHESISKDRDKLYSEYAWIERERKNLNGYRSFLKVITDQYNAKTK